MQIKSKSFIILLAMLLWIAFVWSAILSNILYFNLIGNVAGEMARFRWSASGQLIMFLIFFGIITTVPVIAGLEDQIKRG